MSTLPCADLNFSHAEEQVAPVGRRPSPRSNGESAPAAPIFRRSKPARRAAATPGRNVQNRTKPDNGDTAADRNNEHPANENRTKADNCDTDQEFLLSPAQELALAALLQGQGPGDAAKAAKVSTRTIHRWRHQDAAFRGALAREQHEIRSAIHSQLIQLARKSLVCIERSLKKGDGHAAIDVLLASGSLHSALAWTTDPADDAAADAARAEYDNSQISVNSQISASANAAESPAAAAQAFADASAEILEFAGLPEPQIQAVFALVGGRNAATAAELAGVSERQVRRWLTDDLRFRRAMCDLQREFRSMVRARLLFLSQLAVFAIHRCIERGDSRVARRLLRCLGLARPSD